MRLSDILFTVVLITVHPLLIDLKHRNYCGRSPEMH